MILILKPGAGKLVLKRGETIERTGNRDSQSSRNLEKQGKFYNIALYSVREKIQDVRFVLCEFHLKKSKIHKITPYMYKVGTRTGRILTRTESGKFSTTLSLSLPPV